VALFNTADKRKPGFRLAMLGFAMVIVVVGLGAFTRLVHAGLGCPDWPTCYGHIWIPNTEAKIAAANEKFPETPVETDKTWPEQIHRIFASGLGLVFIGLVIVAVKSRQPGQPLKLPLFMLAFVILQGLFGMWTVTLKLWPQVVTAHLLGGFISASLLWLLAMRLNNQHWHLPLEKFQPLTALRGWVMTGLVVVVVQIFLGGWLTSNYAAVACHELPTCHNQEYWPEMDFAQGFNLLQEIGPNYLGGQMDNPARTAIHMMHRIGALITTVFLILLFFRMRAIQHDVVTQMSNVLLGGLVLQVLLGLSNIYFHFPVSVAVGHNLFGLVLLLIMVTLCHRIYTARIAA
jgi:cytochrome c oxidase assembly protein subunit 15